MTTATPTKPESLLPREKTPPRKGIDGKKLLLYGFPKVGKSTLASQFSDRTLFLATDPGQDALEVFKVDVGSWQEFLSVGKELANLPADGRYDWIVVDTIDTLARYCRDHVMGGLAKSENMDPDGYVHPSDFPYGKGWDSVSEEFRLRIARLCSVGSGVIFISHVKESVKKTRTGLEISTLASDIGNKGMRQWLVGFVDFIVFAQVLETPEGERHVLHLKPSENFEAGARVPDDKREALPAQIPMSAEGLRDTLAEVLA